MSYIRITPSSYPRLARCLGGAVLPNAVETLPGMSRGTAIHAFLQRVGEGASVDEALAFVPVQWREDCAAIPLSKLPDLTTGTSELAMAWSPSTGACRLLGAGLSREEAAARVTGDEVPMLADWAARVGESGGVLLDHKTGWAEQLAPAHEHLQLLTYGSVYLLALGLESVELYLCRPDRNTPRWDGPVLLDRLDAEAHLARIVALMDDVHRARAAWAERSVLPPLHIGPWCEWCPARRRCPEHVGALLAVLEGDAERAVRNVVELTPEQAGSLWQTLKAAEKLLRRLLDELRGIAAKEALPLPDGRRLTEVPTLVEEPMPEKVEAWLRTRFGEEVARAAVRPHVTWGHLEDVVTQLVLPERKAAHADGRWQGERPTKKALLREVRQGLVAANAVKLVPGTEVRAVRALPEGQSAPGADEAEDAA